MMVGGLRENITKRALVSDRNITKSALVSDRNITKSALVSDRYKSIKFDTTITGDNEIEGD
jgi:hypothetical protein